MGGIAHQVFKHLLAVKERMGLGIGFALSGGQVGGDGAGGLKNGLVEINAAAESLAQEIHGQLFVGAGGGHHPGRAAMAGVVECAFDIKARDIGDAPLAFLILGQHDGADDPATLDGGTGGTVVEGGDVLAPVDGFLDNAALAQLDDGFDHGLDDRA